MREAVETILRKIEDLQQTNEHLVIAIDGRCTAGKTTLAARLQETLSCTRKLIPSLLKESPLRIGALVI